MRAGAGDRPCNQMKVAELIEELSKHDPETLVVFERAPYGTHEGFDRAKAIETLTIRPKVAKESYIEGEFVMVEGWEENFEDWKERLEGKREAITILTWCKEENDGE